MSKIKFTVTADMRVQSFLCKIFHVAMIAFEIFLVRQFFSGLFYNGIMVGTIVEFQATGGAKRFFANLAHYFLFVLSHRV